VELVWSGSVVQAQETWLGTELRRTLFPTMMLGGVEWLRGRRWRIGFVHYRYPDGKNGSSESYTWPNIDAPAEFEVNTEDTTTPNGLIRNQHVAFLARRIHITYCEKWCGQEDQSYDRERFHYLIVSHSGFRNLCAGFTLLLCNETESLRNLSI